MPSIPYLKASLAKMAFVEKQTAPIKTSKIPLMYAGWFFNQLFLCKVNMFPIFMLLLSFIKLSNKKGNHC